MSQLSACPNRRHLDGGVIHENATTNRLSPLWIDPSVVGCQPDQAAIGNPPRYRPLVIEHREPLIYMLCAAAELEHALMCEYLFAASR